MSTLTLRLAFLGAFQDWRGGSWDTAVRRHTTHVFPSRSRRAGLDHIVRELDAAGAVDRVVLRVAGYSWGAWTSLQIARLVAEHPGRIHPTLEHARVEPHVGLLDPVGTLRSRMRVPSGVPIYNVFQRNGCFRGCPGLSKWYRGCAVPGAALNLDVTLEGRELPLRDGVPPDRAPDHIQMGYRSWGGYDEAIAAVLTDGVPAGIETP